MTNQLYNIQNKYSIHFLKNTTMLWSDNHSKEAKEKLIKLKKILEHEQSKVSNNYDIQRKEQFMITETTKYGKGYESPQGLEENQYYDLMYEFVDLAKVKRLTVRQAQKLFTDCADMILDVKPTNESIGTDYFT